MAMNWTTKKLFVFEGFKIRSISISALCVLLQTFICFTPLTTFNSDAFDNISTIGIYIKSYDYMLMCNIILCSNFIIHQFLDKCISSSFVMDKTLRTFIILCCIVADIADIVWIDNDVRLRICLLHAEILLLCFGITKFILKDNRFSHSHLSVSIFLLGISLNLSCFSFFQSGESSKLLRFMSIVMHGFSLFTVGHTVLPFIRDLRVQQKRFSKDYVAAICLTCLLILSLGSLICFSMIWNDMAWSIYATALICIKVVSVYSILTIESRTAKYLAVALKVNINS